MPFTETKIFTNDPILRAITAKPGLDWSWGKACGTAVASPLGQWLFAVAAVELRGSADFAKNARALKKLLHQCNHCGGSDFGNPNGVVTA